MRDRWIRIRVSTEDYERLKELSQGHEMNVSEYVRFCCFGSIAAGKFPDASKITEILAHLGQLGNNVNQATKAIHEAKLHGILSAQQFGVLGRILKESREFREQMRSDVLRAMRAEAHEP